MHALPPRSWHACRLPTHSLGWQLARPLQAQSSPNAPHHHSPQPTLASASQANLMSDYGSMGDPASELLRLLTTGAVGGALQQYLTATLGAMRGRGKEGPSRRGLKAAPEAENGASRIILHFCRARQLLPALDVILLPRSAALTPLPPGPAHHMPLRRARPEEAGARCGRCGVRCAQPADGPPAAAAGAAGLPAGRAAGAGALPALAPRDGPAARAGARAGLGRG